jgi:hypothetical protein
LKALKQTKVMTFRLFSVCAVLLLCLGCGKSSSLPLAASVATNAGNSAAASEAGLANILAELTQALRKFSAEKRQVPASLSEVVAAGYLKNLPQPPPGKAFAIDPKNLQVLVK